MKRIPGLIGSTAYDSRGEILGKVHDIYISEESGRPDFATLNYGIFGSYFIIVPLRGHRIIDEHLHMAFTKEQMRHAPTIVNEGELTDAIRSDLIEYYELADTADLTVYLPLDNDDFEEPTINAPLISEIELDPDEKQA